jgi:uncharacterized membrane protein YsdA (DUF1294 family)
VRRLLLAGIVALNVIAVIAMAFDKLRAVRGGRRVPERTLLLLALPLAAPGTWLGLWMFSHKQSKRSFKLALWLVTFLNVAIGLLVWRAVRGRI